MGFLISSILCSVLVSVLLKVARPKQINLAVAIMVNYIVCVTLTWFVLSPTITADTVRTGAWIFGALGILLPSIFLVMGKSVESAGIVKSDTAQRLALIIPIIASFTLFGEALNTNKAIALVLVFVAMGCLLYKKSNSHKSAYAPHANLWLIGVFVGYGVIDVLLKQLSKMGSATAGNLMISFSLALVVMVMYLIVKKIKPTPVSIAGGILLGILNFANIYTYISAHKAMSDTPTLVFAGMNMGVIVLGALTGLLIFKEKLSTINVLGIVIVLIVIAKLYLL